MYCFPGRHSGSLGSRVASCCGVSAYDESDNTSVCCGGRLHTALPAPGGGECCGKLLIDPNTHQCCRSPQFSLIYPLHTSFHCCGHHYYNSSHQRCCSQQLGVKPQPDVKLMALVKVPMSTLCNSAAVVGKVTNVSQKGQQLVWWLKSSVVLKANCDLKWMSTHLRPCPHSSSSGPGSSSAPNQSSMPPMFSGYPIPSITSVGIRLLIT
ncbi:uncharacterized protein LOC121852153 [Callorhinchus milii]|uniref:uncharacterized protein LOC121852153 n=1 Tax=Callorhinchus milii TaxID=7868 RepID=UPI001C3F7FB6|nr:uncharacterized protein LOC121852153 [Callorhinchus milii]